MLSSYDLRQEWIKCFGCAGRRRGEEGNISDEELQEVGQVPVG